MHTACQTKGRIATNQPTDFVAQPLNQHVWDGCRDAYWRGVLRSPEAAGSILMSRKLGFLASLALISATAPATALAGGVFLTLGGAIGDVSFEGDTFAENNVPSDHSWGYQAAVGYRFDSKLVIEGRATFGVSLDWLF